MFKYFSLSTDTVSDWLTKDSFLVNMGRERQKKKNRSSIPKARLKSNRTKAGKKKVNFLGNETIAKNW